MNKVVLVVGAGASKAFNVNMGVGSDLREDIRMRVTDQNVPVDQRYFSKLLEYKLGFKPSIREAFTYELEKYVRATPNGSIDSFLNYVNVTPSLNTQRSDFLRLGKIAIAFHVLGYEGGCLGSAAFQNRSWLDVLDDIIYPNGSNIKIITFNYDRLIEEYLYRRQGNKAIRFCEESVVHIYNKLAPLAWQNNSRFVMFGHPNNDARLIDEYHGTPILMYDSRNEKNSLKEQAQRWIDDSQLILFMGYSFDNYNNGSLNLAGVERKRLIIHCYDKRDIPVIKNRLNNVRCEKKFYGGKCSSFLKRHLRN